MVCFQPARIWDDSPKYRRWNVPSSIITIISCRHVIFKYSIFSHTSQPCLGKKRHHGNNVLSCPHSNSAQDQGGRVHKKHGPIFFGTTRRRPSMGDSRGFFAHGLVTGSITFFVLGVVASMISSTFFVKETTNITKQESIRILGRRFKVETLCRSFCDFLLGSKGETGSIGSSFNELAVCVCTTWVHPVSYSRLAVFFRGKKLPIKKPFTVISRPVTSRRFPRNQL